MIGRVPSYAVFVTSIVSFALVSALTSGPASAADPGVACAVATQKAVAKLLSRKLKCYGTAMKEAAIPDLACLTEAQDKFDAFWDRALQHGCTGGPVGNISTDWLLTEFLADLLAVTTATPVEGFCYNDVNFSSAAAACVAAFDGAECQACISTAPPEVYAACVAAADCGEFGCRCAYIDLNLQCAAAVSNAGCASACCQ